MPTDQRRVQAVFLAAAEQDAGDRVPLLDRECGSDAELRQRVEALLQAHDDPGSFLDHATGELGPTIDQPIAEKPGTVIGRYKLRELIGEGGFGLVYVAEQTEPVRRKVALKLIKPGMDSREVVARFEAERQALALMDHPNVARVLDAGASESGRPYFVMELVHGIPLAEFCDQQKLTTPQRLRLFVDVCRAVQHAHQKGIIHRDLKPSNIMVTLHDGKPVPKVIDFGVAKALCQQLTEKSVYTAYGQMIGTPLYMSPEQVEMSGLDVDTRSDIYSLGVLLYELLTGTTPFDKETLRKADFDEMRRMIREDEPPRPSARVSTLEAVRLSTISDQRQIDSRKLGQSLRGELDWIVMKALEKDRTRRYETANGFAADVQCYLNDEPVAACPPSAAYRFRKFTRRNKVALATAALVAAALVLGVMGTTWQAFRAKEAEGVAKTERDIANAERNHAVEAKQRAVKAEKQALASRQKAEEHSQEVTRLLASSYVDRAQALCEQGEIGRGMLWFAHSLKTAPLDAGDLQQAIRTNLAAWSRQLHRLRTLAQCPGSVRAVAISPDGSRILAGSSDGTVRFWDAATGRAVGEGIRLDGEVQAVAFSPDGSRILTLSDNATTARLWNAGTLKPIGEPLRHKPLGEPPKTWHAVNVVAFSPDGSRLVTSSVSGYAVGTLRLWDAATLASVGEPFERGAPMAIRFCPDGLRVVLRLVDGNCQVWDVQRDEAIGPSVVPNGRVVASAISPDGVKFATATPKTAFQLWDGATGKRASPPLVHGGVVGAIAFSPDGRRVVSGGNTRVARLWDTATGQRIGTPLRQRSTVRAVAFSTDGTRILTGSDDGSVRLWDVAPDDSLGQPIQHQDRLVTAAFSPAGLRVLTERDGWFQLRDATTGEALGKAFEHQDDDMRMSLSRDGSRLLLHAGYGAQLRDVATGQLIGQPFPRPTDLIGQPLPAITGIHDAAFSPDGSRILAGYQHGVAVLFDANTLEPVGEPLHHPTRPVTGPEASVHCVAFSPDGSRILTGGYDGITRLWDAATLGPIGEPLVHQSEVTALAYGPDGSRVLTGLADGTVRLWDLVTLEPLGPPLHHQEVVCSVAFGPDGSRFLTCSLDQTIRLWDTATQKPIGPTLKHEAWWPEVSFSLDGSQFLVADQRGTARLWKTPPGPLEEDRERIVLWAQVITGLELDDLGGISGLDGPTWQKLHVRLQQRGGPRTAGKDTSDEGLGDLRNEAAEPLGDLHREAAQEVQAKLRPAPLPKAKSEEDGSADEALRDAASFH